MFKTDSTKLKEHISPEGVEEKILKKMSCMITQTQGGKFRIYQNNTPFGKIFDDKEKAEEAFKSLVSMIAMFEIDPERATGIFIDALKDMT